VSKDSFVVTGTFVLLINICGESLALRVAANRYKQAQQATQQQQQQQQQQQPNGRL